MQIPTHKRKGNGCFSLLEAIKRFSPDTKFYQASTSEMFLRQSLYKPKHKSDCLTVCHEELFSHWMTVNYRESHDLKACCGILFNHESQNKGHRICYQKDFQCLCQITDNKYV